MDYSPRQMEARRELARRELARRRSGISTFENQVPDDSFNTQAGNSNFTPENIERAKSALRNAHAAGDTVAAKQIANALKASQQGADYSLEQQRALALARAKRNRAESSANPSTQPNNATYDPAKLKSALIQAHNAGDTEAAQMFADVLKQQAPTGNNFDRGTFGAISDSLSSGVMAGFDDEIGAGMIAPIKAGINWAKGDGFNLGEEYDTQLAVNRQRKGERQEQHPIASTLGEVTGAMTMAGPLSKLPGLAKPAAGMIGKMIQGSYGAGVAGGLYGFGDGEGGLENRVNNAGQSAALSAVVGAAAPPLIAGAGNTASKIRQAITGKLGTDGFAVSKVAQAAQRSGLTPDDFQQRFSGLQNSQLGDDAMMVDAMGDSGRRLARAVADRGGRGANDLIETTTNRQAAQAERVTGALSKELGDPANYHAELDAVSSRMKTAAKPYYDAAYSKPVSATPELKAVIQRVPSQAVQSAQRIAKADGVALDSLPALQRLDYIKRGLDDLIDSQDGRGAFGSMNTYGRSLTGVKNDLLGELDKAVPEYAQARSIYADDAKLKTALEAGRKALNVDSETTAKTLAAMSEGERELFRLGIGRELQKQIGNRSSDLADVTRKVWTPNRQAMLKEAFGNEQGFERFARSIQAEQEAAKTFGAVNSGSKTARYQNDLGESGMVGDFVNDSGRAGIVQALMKATGRATNGMSEKSADKIAKLLMSPPSKLDASLAKALRGENGKNAKRELIVKLLALGNASQDLSTKNKTAAGVGVAAATPFLAARGAVNGTKGFIAKSIAAGAAR